LMGHIALSF